MQLFSKAIGLFSRFGAPIKFVAKTALNAVLPGSPAVVDLVCGILDCVTETSKNNPEFKEDKMPPATAADLARVEKVLDIMSIQLAPMLERLIALEGMPDLMEQALDRLIATDKNCQQATAQLEELAQGFDRLAQQNREILAKQGYTTDLLEEMVPVVKQLAGMGNFVGELKSLNLTVAEMARQLAEFRDATQKALSGHATQATAAFRKLDQTGAGVVGIAVSQVMDQDVMGAEKTITRASELRPEDQQLKSLQKRLTRVSQSAQKVAAAPESFHVKTGDDLDGWKLDKLLGRGGFGQVFVAKREEQVRAIKLLHPHLSADGSFVERFKREIMTLVRLGDHPHLVAIHTFGCASRNGAWYLVMEYIHGRSLESMLEEPGRKLESAEILKIFVGVSRGLAHAHAHGVVHRDIKPANILIREDGVPHLGDFGLASVAHAGRNVSQSTALGTAMFASPEQLRGRPTDSRTDVYSLAATLYYCLAYEHADRREPDQYDPTVVPEGCRDLLQRSLSAQVTIRPMDAAAFLLQLEQAIEQPWRQAIQVYERHIDAGEYDAAWKVYDKQIRQPLMDRADYAYQLTLLERLFIHGLDRLPPLSSTEDQAWALFTLGVIENSQGRPENADWLFRVQLAIDTSAGRKVALLGYAWGVNTYAQRNELFKIEAWFLKALAITRYLKSAYHESNILGTLAHNYLIRGEFAQAQVCIDRMKEQKDDDWFIAWAAHLEADRALQEGDLKTCEQRLVEARANIEKRRANRQMLTNHTYFVYLALKKGNLYEAERILKQLTDVAQVEGSLGDRLEWRYLTAELHQKRGDTRGARGLVRDLLGDTLPGCTTRMRAKAWLLQAKIEQDDRRITQAGEAAKNAYTLAWGDGPPYGYAELLKEAKELLTRLGVTPPQLKERWRGLAPLPNVPLKPEGEVTPEMVAEWWPTPKAGVSNTSKWTPEQVRQKLEEVKVAIDYPALAAKNPPPSAFKWWDSFEKQNADKQPLILRMAEELAIRNTSIEQFFLAYVYSDDDNIQANLNYLDFTVSKKATDQPDPTKGDPAQRLMEIGNIPGGLDQNLEPGEGPMRVRRLERLVSWDKVGGLPGAWWALAKVENANRPVALCRILQVTMEQRIPLEEYFQSMARSTSTDWRAALQYTYYLRLRKKPEALLDDAQGRFLLQIVQFLDDFCVEHLRKKLLPRAEAQGQVTVKLDGMQWDEALAALRQPAVASDAELPPPPAMLRAAPAATAVNNVFNLVCQGLKLTRGQIFPALMHALIRTQKALLEWAITNRVELNLTEMGKTLSKAGKYLIDQLEVTASLLANLPSPHTLDYSRRAVWNNVAAAVERANPGRGLYDRLKRKWKL